MSKRVVLTIDNVRIKEYDRMNLTVERYEDVFIPKDRQMVKKWVFKGYVSSILKGLLLIQEKELLIDKNEVGNLNDYVNQVENSNKKLVKVAGENK